MRWPGKIPAGTTCHHIAGNIDLLPTFAKLVGVEPPKDRVLDGRDISTLMFDRTAGPVRDTHLYFNANQNLAAIRQGDWKLFLSAPAPKGQAKNVKADKPAAKNAEPESTGPQLYNLATDPAETNNVAADQPQIVAKLQAEAERREAEIRQHRRPAGQLSALK